MLGAGGCVREGAVRARCRSRDGGAGGALQRRQRQPRGEPEHRDSCDADRTVCDFTEIGVAAARVRGTKVAALVIVGAYHLVLLYSEDSGATFRTIDLVDDDFVRGGQLYVGGTDVLLTDAGPQLFLLRDEPGAQGRTYRRGRLAAIDMASGKLTLDVSRILPGSPAFDVTADYALFADAELDPRGGGSVSTMSFYELAFHGADRSALLPCGICDATAFGGTDDGDHYAGYVGDSPSATQACLLSYTRSLASVGAVCVPRAEWPAAGGTSESQDSMPYAGKHARELRLFSHGGHGWATGITNWIGATGGGPVAALPPIDLGPGKVVPSGSFGLRQRHAGLAVVDPNAVVAGSGDSQLVRVLPGGHAQTVVLPRTPCVDDAHCGDPVQKWVAAFGQVAWTESIGVDDYLVFYLHDADPSPQGYAPVIYVSRERATYRDVAAVPFGTTGAPPGYEGAREASAVEKVCIRAVSCSPSLMNAGMSDSFYQCVGAYYAEPAATASAQRAALADALAAPAGCEYFQGFKFPTFDQSPCGASCGRTGGTCSKGSNGWTCRYPPEPAQACNTCSASGQAIGCNNGTVTQVLDCAAVGQTCTCPRDGTGACTAVPTCKSPACTQGSPAQCTGDVYSICDVDGTVYRRECGYVGMSCTTAPAPFAGCKAPDGLPPSAQCNGNTSVPLLCSGDYLVTCLGGQVHYADCKALGFSQCAPTPNVPRCRP